MPDKIMERIKFGIATKVDNWGAKSGLFQRLGSISCGE